MATWDISSSSSSSKDEKLSKKHQKCNIDGFWWENSNNEVASSNEESLSNNNEVNSSKLEYLYDTIVYLTNAFVKSKDRNKVLSKKLKEIKVEFNLLEIKFMMIFPSNMMN